MNHGIAKTLLLIVGLAGLIALAPYLPNSILYSNKIVLNPEPAKAPARATAPVPVAPKATPAVTFTAMARPMPMPLPQPTLVSDEATNLFVPNESPEETDRRLAHLAESLNDSTAAQLTHTALDGSRNADERFLATYVLGQRPKDYARELRQIAVAHPRTEQDTTVQIQAMLALETGRSGARVFDDICRAHHNPLLIKVAQLGIRGAQDGRPLIRNYIDLRVAEILDAVR